METQVTNLTIKSTVCPNFCECKSLTGLALASKLSMGPVRSE